MSYIDYKQIIIDGYRASKEQGTAYASYFKQQAQINGRDNFVDYADFFSGCRQAVKEYHNEILKEYNQRLSENDWVLNDYRRALERGKQTDQNGEPIQKHIDYIESDKKYVKERGYENSDYACMVTETGKITTDCFKSRHKLYYSDIVALEQAIMQAVQELIPATVKPLPAEQIILPSTLLQELEKEGFIENAEARPLKWIKTNSTTKGINPNKKSLLDLLCLLEYPDIIIKNRTLLNSLFIFQNNKPLAAQNYTNLTDSKGQIKRPIISEYHSELENIVTKSKEK